MQDRSALLLVPGQKIRDDEGTLGEVLRIEVTAHPPYDISPYVKVWARWETNPDAELWAYADEIELEASND